MEYATACRRADSPALSGETKTYLAKYAWYQKNSQDQRGPWSPEA